MNAHGRLFRTQSAAAVFGHGQFSFFDLPFPGVASQLSDQFMDLRQTRCTERMTARGQAAAWIDGDTAGQTGFAFFGQNTAFAPQTEPEVLSLVDLAEGCGVMDFGYIDILRTDTGSFMISM